MAVLCTSIFAGMSSIQWVACFFTDTHTLTACGETGKCNLHTKNLINYFLLSIWNISIVLNLPFSRVVLSPLVNIYLLEEFSFSVGSRCCFFSLESTLLPCRYPLPGKGASASFLFLLEVSPCVEWLLCILMSLALHGPALSFSCGMFQY